MKKTTAAAAAAAVAATATGAVSALFLTVGQAGSPQLAEPAATTTKLLHLLRYLDFFKIVHNYSNTN